MIPKWLKSSLQQDDVVRINQALIKAESATSAEIVPILVGRSSQISYLPLLIFSFLVLCFCLLDLFGFFTLFSSLSHSNFAEILSDKNFYITIMVIVSCVLLAGFLSRFAVLQRALISEEEKSLQTAERAELEFYRHVGNKTKSRNGILIFISFMEHRVIVMADKAIIEKLPPTTWDSMVADIVASIRNKSLGVGLEKAILNCGEILSPHFQRETNDQNELKDELLIFEY
ncbi:MAG: hypothetical protein KBD78_05230 [Oligoflexales bacterium]|nr:hypothetical protein [Oligoflexales bacterium]